ncbi:MAG: hypothetical protein M1429_01315 [Patescibacteria group bacterium]|nr:hypothetical protein [Patescibacteria group bacterium]
MKTLVLVFLFFVTSLPVFAADMTWNIPPVDRVVITKNPEGTWPSGGTINIALPKGMFALGWLNGGAPFNDGRFHISSLTLEPDITYQPDTHNQISENKYESFTCYDIGCKLELWPSAYEFSVTGTYGEPKKNWYPSGPGAVYELGNSIGGAPLFGLAQITQVGDQTLLPGGKTVSAIGCPTCSLAAIAGYNNVGDALTLLKKNHCYSGNNIIWAKAARTLGMVLLGTKSWSQDVANKETARGNDIVIKVKSPHRNKKRGFYWGEHWVAKGPGIFIGQNGLDSGIMDSACRFNYVGTSKYVPQLMKVLTSIHHFIVMHDRWWEKKANLYAMFYGGWYTVSVASNTVFATTTSVASPIISLENKPTLSQLRVLLAPKVVAQSASVKLSSLTTVQDVLPASLVDPGAILSGVSICSQRCFIERIDSMAITLTRNSAFGDSSLEDAVSIDNSDDEDEFYDGDMTGVPDQIPDHSQAQLWGVPRGSIRIVLFGQPNAVWTINIGHFDPMGNNSDEVLTGQLNENGEGSVTFSHTYTEAIDNNTNVKQLPIGTKFYVDSLEVIDEDAANGQFFVENTSRTWGMRVINNDPQKLYPGRTHLAGFSGKLVSVSPEIVVEADLVNGSFDPVAQPIQPLGMPGKWPEMANNLLGRIWGKVTNVDGTTVTIIQGNEPLTVSGVDIPVKTDDILTVNAVLRPDRILKAIPGSAVVANN